MGEAMTWPWPKAEPDGYEYSARIETPSGEVLDTTTSPKRKPRFWFGVAWSFWRSHQSDCVGILLRRPEGSDDLWTEVERRD